MSVRALAGSRLPDSSFGRIRADPRNHRSETVGTLSGQVLLEAEFGKYWFRVYRQNLIGFLAIVNSKENGDQPAHDMRVAVGLKSKLRRSAVVSTRDTPCKPDLAGATAHLIFFGSELIW